MSVRICLARSQLTRVPFTRSYILRWRRNNLGTFFEATLVQLTLGLSALFVLSEDSVGSVILHNFDCSLLEICILRTEQNWICMTFEALVIHANLVISAASSPCFEQSEFANQQHLCVVTMNVNPFYGA